MKKKRTRILVIVLVIVAMVVAGASLLFTRVRSNLESLKSLAIVQIDPAALRDGSYTGTYSAFPVSAEVSVTVKDHAITAIALVKHVSGQGKAAEAIPGMVVEAQSLQVDTVSGATYSSVVILKAIENALMASGK